MAVESGLVGEGPHFIAVVRGDLRFEGIAHLDQLLPAIAAAVGDLHQLFGIVGEFSGHVAGKSRLLPADLLRRAGDDEHWQVVNVTQLAGLEPTFLKRPCIFGGGQRQMYKQGRINQKIDNRKAAENSRDGIPGGHCTEERDFCGKTCNWRGDHFKGV